MKLERQPEVMEVWYEKLHKMRYLWEEPFQVDGSTRFAVPDWLR